MSSSSYNSFLKYTNIQGKTLTYNMWVMEYSQTHALAGTSAQSKMFKHYYPKSYSPGNVSVIGRVRTQSDYNNLGTYIRNFHITLMNSSGRSNAGSKQLPLMMLFINGEGLNIQGIPASFQAGAKRFNVAPEFRFDFMVIKDAHSKNADMRPGYAMRQMWTGDFIDEGAIDTGNVVDGARAATTFSPGVTDFGG